VRLAVHDAAGRLIRTLVAEAGSAGLHSVLWDGVDDGGQRAAPGAYFCRLTSGGVHATTRIVLLP
jgi:flagellar hook assembly protein FlgD